MCCPTELQTILDDLQGSSRDLVLDVYPKQTKKTDKDVVLIDNKGVEWEIVVSLICPQPSKVAETIKEVCPQSSKVTDTLPEELEPILQDLQGSSRDLVLDVYPEQTKKTDNDVVLVDNKSGQWAIFVGLQPKKLQDQKSLHSN